MQCQDFSSGLLGKCGVIYRDKEMGKRTDGLGSLTDGPIEFRHIETKMMGSNQMEMLQGQLEMY